MSQDNVERDLAEVAVDVQRHCSQLRPPLVRDWKLENRWQTTSTDPRSQRNRASRRGGH
jgi:hypothetical protein